MSLPVAAADMASACMTARVPRAHLTLVVVRVVVTDAAGVVVPGACHAVGVLTDNRHTLAGLYTNVAGAVAACRRDPGPPDAVLVYTKLAAPAAFVHVPMHGDMTLAEHMTVADGAFRDATRTGGAVYAWQRQCSVRTRVCIADAVRGLTAAQRLRVPPEYAIGLGKLTGGGKPTQRVPDACACTRDPACDCFMRRAMYRAGTTWLVVYAVIPPPRVTGPRRWEYRLAMAASSSVSSWAMRLQDDDGALGCTVLPHMQCAAWPAECPLLVPVLWSRTAVDDDDTLSASEACVPVRDPLPVVHGTHSVLTFAAYWAVHQQPRKRLIAAWTDAARLVGPYYGPPLRRVLSLVHGPGFAAAFCAAQSVHDPADDDRMYAALQRYGASHGPGHGLVQALRAVVGPERTTRTIRTLAGCEHLGYTAAAMVALMLYVDDGHMTTTHDTTWFASAFHAMPVALT